MSIIVEPAHGSPGGQEGIGACQSPDWASGEAPGTGNSECNHSTLWKNVLLLPSLQHPAWCEDIGFLPFSPPLPPSSDWSELLEAIDSDLHWLLTLPYHKFWSQVGCSPVYLCNPQYTLVYPRLCMMLVCISSWTPICNMPSGQYSCDWFHKLVVPVPCR